MNRSLTDSVTDIATDRPPSQSGQSDTRSHGRTDGRTDEELGHPLRKSCSSATPAGGLQRIIELGSGHDPVRTRESRKPSPRFQLGPVDAPDGPTRTSMLLFPDRPSRGGGVSRFKMECSGLSRSRPLTRELKSASCTNTATRRVQAILIDARRHLSTSRRVACSPIARWHGKSSGSDPLRRPTNISAAHRAMQYDDACLTPLASLPLVAFEKGFIPLRGRGFSAVCVTLRTVTSQATLDRATGTP